MKPYYYSLNEYLKETYGTKLYKLALDGGMSCPNRDGLIDTRGCIFCSAGGSGDFSGHALSRCRTAGQTEAKYTVQTNSTVEQISPGQIALADSTAKQSVPAGSSSQISMSAGMHLRTFVADINTQLDAAKHLIAAKYNGAQYIAYFQSYTNTYADTEYLRRLFYPVIERDDIRILSIATRPDCLAPETLRLLSELNRIKPVWIELGLQTIHEATAEYIRRGYKLSVFEDAVNKLSAIGIKPIVHMIIGLPGETEAMIMDTAEYIAHSSASGIKLQLLHVLKGTDLAYDYTLGKFEVLSLETYVKYLGKIIQVLPKNMVIHRLTGDGPKNQLIAPLWSTDKKNVLNTINSYFKTNNIYQGRNYL